MMCLWDSEGQQTVVMTKGVEWGGGGGGGGGVCRCLITAGGG